jgi:hypothetical protein
MLDIDSPEYIRSKLSYLVDALRWIFLLPTVVLGSLLVWWLIGLINWIGFFLYMGPSEWWPKIWEATTGSLIFGAAIPFIAFHVAPSHKYVVAFVFSGLLLFLSGGVVFYSLDLFMYSIPISACSGRGIDVVFALVAIFLMNIGSVAVSFALYKGKI